MKTLSVLLFVLLASLNLTAYSGPGIPSDTIPSTDSTEILGAPIYIWNKIFQDLYAGDAAQKLIGIMQEELNQAEKVQKKTDQALKEAHEMTEVAKKESKSWEERYDIKDKQNEQTHKEKRRYKRERDVAIFLDVVLTVVILIVAL